MDQSKALKEQETKLQEALVAKNLTSPHHQGGAPVTLPSSPLPTGHVMAHVTSAAEGGVGNQIMLALKEALDQLTLKVPSSASAPLTLSSSSPSSALVDEAKHQASPTLISSPYINPHIFSDTLIYKMTSQVSLRFEKLLKEDSLQPFLALLSAAKTSTLTTVPSTAATANDNHSLPVPSMASESTVAATAVSAGAGAGGSGGGYILLSRAVARRSCGDMLLDPSSLVHGAGSDKGARVPLSITA